jgi:hypothetical protein
MTPTPLKIEWVRRGDIVQAPSLMRIDETEPYMAISRCEDLLAYHYCETHRQALANVAQLEMHVEKGGEHRIAVYCDRHRCYEEAAPVNLQVLAL